jgi:hypothetical protein
MNMSRAGDIQMQMSNRIVLEDAFNLDDCDYGGE